MAYYDGRDGRAGSPPTRGRSDYRDMDDDYNHRQQDYRPDDNRSYLNQSQDHHQLQHQNSSSTIPSSANHPHPYDTLPYDAPGRQTYPRRADSRSDDEGYYGMNDRGRSQKQQKEGVVARTMSRLRSFSRGRWSTKGDDHEDRPGSRSQSRSSRHRSNSRMGDYMDNVKERGGKVKDKMETSSVLFPLLMGGAALAGSLGFKAIQAKREHRDYSPPSKRLAGGLVAGAMLAGKVAQKRMAKSHEKENDERERRHRSSSRSSTYRSSSRSSRPYDERDRY